MFNNKNYFKIKLNEHGFFEYEYQMFINSKAQSDLGLSDVSYLNIKFIDNKLSGTLIDICLKNLNTKYSLSLTDLNDIVEIETLINISNI